MDASSPSSTPSSTFSLLDVPKPTSRLCDRCYAVAHAERPPRPADAADKTPCANCQRPVGWAADRNNITDDWVDLGAPQSKKTSGSQAANRDSIADDWVDLGDPQSKKTSDGRAADRDSIADDWVDLGDPRSGDARPRSRMLKPRPCPAAYAAKMAEPASAGKGGVKIEGKGKGKGKADSR